MRVLPRCMWPFNCPIPATLMPFGFAYVLPVGISFFTFQSMSYTIDFYLGNVHRERNFLRFATFVCFFPAADGRADRAGQTPAARSSISSRRSGCRILPMAFAFSGRPFQKTGAGQLPFFLRRARLRQSQGPRRTCL